MERELRERNENLYAYFRQFGKDTPYREIGRKFPDKRTGKPLSRARVCQIIKVMQDREQLEKVTVNA